MNNSGYGETMENLRDRVTVRLVTNAKVYRKLVNKLTLFLKKYQ